MNFFITWQDVLNHILTVSIHIIKQKIVLQVITLKKNTVKIHENKTVNYSIMLNGLLSVDFKSLTFNFIKMLKYDTDDHDDKRYLLT